MLTVTFGAGLVTAAFVLLWWSVSGDRGGRTAVARNLAADHPSTTDMRDALLRHSATDRVVGPLGSRLAKAARRATPSGMLDSLERRILLAGGSASWPLERVLAMKAVLAAIGLAFGGLRILGHPSTGGVLVAAVTATFGYFLPDILLYNQAQKRQAAIQLALPDTLDQVTISVEAGLGLEASLARAGQTGKGPLAEELIRLIQDVRAGMSRGDALRGLADRTKVPDVSRVVMALLQADSYGVPVSRVLRIQSRELRVKRRQRAEEQAMKLPVKVLMPLVSCIFPVIFIVLLGPAGIQIARVFHGLHK